MKFVQRADGGAALPDDMPPVERALALLLEHANQRREDGLPLPCPCLRVLLESLVFDELAGVWCRWASRLIDALILSEETS